MEYTVNLIWDNEAFVWVATSDDVNGLVLESGSIDALIDRVKIAIPELLELNNELIQDTIIGHGSKISCFCLN